MTEKSDCEFCDEQHDEWVVLEFNEDYNYGGVFKSKALAEAFIATRPNRKIDGLFAAPLCHWAGELELNDEEE